MEKRRLYTKHAYHILKMSESVLKNQPIRQSRKPLAK